MRWLLSLLLLSLTSMVNAADCPNTLAEFGAVPSIITLKNCEHIESGQEHFITNYLVSGKNAAQAEKWLQERFDMKPLYYLCCGWEPVDRSDFRQNRDGRGHYLNKISNQYYDITMTSGETLTNERSQWPSIPQFFISVTWYPEGAI